MAVDLPQPEGPITATMFSSLTNLDNSLIAFVSITLPFSAFHSSIISLLMSVNAIYSFNL